jgi:hypothetical protein
LRWPGHPEPTSNMTTWVNSQFPRPDFHRQVQRHYGLQYRSCADMIHVVDFEKTAFSTSFRGVLAPSGPQISAESGRATHCLAPGKPGWPPTSNWPLFSRPTPHAPPAGSGRARTLPAGYCLPPTAELAEIERGRSRVAAPLYSVCHRTRRLLRKNQSVSPHSLPPNR